MLEQWLAWHHLIFLLPLTAAVLMVLLAGLSDLHVGGSDADAAAHVDAHGTDDTHAALHGDTGTGDHTDHGDWGLWEFISLFGVGHVPLSLVLQTIAILWGGVGLVLIQVAPPTVAIGGAALVTLVGARAMAVVLGRLLGTAGAPTTQAQFVGKTGHVVLEVTPRFGVVHVHDERGTVHRLNARTEKEVLPPGQPIVIVGYDPEAHLYEVADPVRYLESGGR
jgi:membrane protein implicated in regulation of membrane protease activity